MFTVLREVLLKRKFETLSITALNAIFKEFRFIHKAVWEPLKNFKQQRNVNSGGFEKIDLTDMNKMEEGRLKKDALLIRFLQQSKQELKAGINAAYICKNNSMVLDFFLCEQEKCKGNCDPE